MQLDGAVRVGQRLADHQRIARVIFDQQHVQHDRNHGTGTGDANRFHQRRWRSAAQWTVRW